MKCGIDIVDIKRFENPSQHFLQRVFTAEEIDYALSKGRASQTFAGIFAAKEAFLKTVGTGIFGGIALTDITVSHNVNGRPFLILSDKIGINSDCVDISISHTDQTAVAMCIIM